MRKAYICSPYRAKDGAGLERNIEYARALTKLALDAGVAPVTPHLYMTQCLDEDKPQERARGMAAGLELLKGCDLVIVGVKYGVSEGMSREIRAAERMGIRAVNAERLRSRMDSEACRTKAAARDYARECACNFCRGSRLHSCTGYDCREPYRRAYEYAVTHEELLQRRMGTKVKSPYGTGIP